MQQEVILPPSIDDIPPPGLALVEELDQVLLVHLRDGKKVLGILRSFDQFANLILEDAKERIIVGKEFAEVPLGLYVVRGENVVLIGEVDETRDPPQDLKRVSETEIRQAQNAEKEAEKMRGSLLARFDFLDE